jgi:aryl-alcohol dehydrogenase-like predicted oxidoreductase
MAASKRKRFEIREFGRTGMKITNVGLGTWAIGGGGWSFAWGAQDDNESVEAIRRVIELDINWIDTAPVYGTGHAEEIVGKTLSGSRPPPYVFTKASFVWDSKRRVRSTQKAESMRMELDASLKRLRTDKLDLCQVHWPEPEGEIEEGWRTLAELKDEGKVLHIGVSNFSVEQMEKVSRIAPVETLQPPYSLVHPEAEKDVIPYAKAHNIGVIVYSPMAAGLLSGTMTEERIKRMPKDDWRQRDSEFRGARLRRNLALADLLGEIGKPYGRSAGEVAIAWTLLNPGVTAAIVGGRSAKQVDGFVGAADLKLTKDDIERITTFVRGNP